MVAISVDVEPHTQLLSDMYSIRLQVKADEVLKDRALCRLESVPIAKNIESL